MIIINDKKSCMGCYACLNICPQSCILMESDIEGFWYPEVDDKKCIKCELCIKVCSILNKTIVKNGPSAYASMNNDESIRLESSSGGLFTLIAGQVIDVDGVVFGAGFAKDFSIVHSYVETKEELGRFRGSKYVQSKVGNTYRQAKDFLKQGRQVLFTGTPCQIGGLKSYLGQIYQNLICIDIICHGVPSPKAWQKYISYREKKAGASTQQITFRNKDKGWKRFSISFLFDNNSEYVQTLDKDLYLLAFLKDICLRPSCYACEFKTLHRHSDITLADFWGIENVLPDMDDDKGTSLIFVNSSKGQSVLDQMKDKIVYKEVDIHQAVSYNSAAIKSVGYNQQRDRFLEKLDKEPFEQLVKEYCSDSIMVRAKRGVITITYIVLKNTGLLNLIKRVLGRK